MRRLVSIFILSLVLLHFAGFYVYFIVRLKAIHSEAKSALRRLPKEELTLLSLTSSQYAQAKEGTDEIQWENKMYDIAYVESSAGMVQVYARHDKDEDNLLSFIKKVIHNAERDTQTTPTALQNFFSLIYVEPSICSATQLADLIKRSTSDHLFLNIHSIDLIIDSPPPRA